MGLKILDIMSSEKKYRVLIEASGSLTSNYIIRAIKEAGCVAVGSDLTSDNFAFNICDDFVIMPKVTDPLLWDKILDLVIANEIDIVIPSLDETLLGWGKRKELFKKLGVSVIISDENTLSVFQDKWLTYNFFKANNIPSPKTSLEAKYNLYKPREGRGGQGVFIDQGDQKTEQIDMHGMVSQEFIKGEEYSVDVFYDKDHKPVYIVPRLRLNVNNGKSTAGQVCRNELIDVMIRKISLLVNFIGPINYQLFIDENNKIQFIEVNPRLAGGMALGFAASENWIKLILSNHINGDDICPVITNYDIKMYRYYNEVFS